MKVELLTGKLYIYIRELPVVYKRDGPPIISQLIESFGEARKVKKTAYFSTKLMMPRA